MHRAFDLGRRKSRAGCRACHSPSSPISGSGPPIIVLWRRSSHIARRWNTFRPRSTNMACMTVNFQPTPGFRIFGSVSSRPRLCPSSKAFCAAFARRLWSSWNLMDPEIRRGGLGRLRILRGLWSATSIRQTSAYALASIYRTMRLKSYETILPSSKSLFTARRGVRVARP